MTQEMGSGFFRNTWAMPPLTQRLNPKGSRRGVKGLVRQAVRVKG